MYKIVVTSLDSEYGDAVMFEATTLADTVVEALVRAYNARLGADPTVFVEVDQ